MCPWCLEENATGWKLSISTVLYTSQITYYKEAGFLASQSNNTSDKTAKHAAKTQALTEDPTQPHKLTILVPDFLHLMRTPSALDQVYKNGVSGDSVSIRQAISQMDQRLTAEADQQKIIKHLNKAAHQSRLVLRT